MLNGTSSGCAALGVDEQIATCFFPLLGFFGLFVIRIEAYEGSQILFDRSSILAERYPSASAIEFERSLGFRLVQ